MRPPIMRGWRVIEGNCHYTRSVRNTTLFKTSNIHNNGRIKNVKTGEQPNQIFNLRKNEGVQKTEIMFAIYAKNFQ